jgi:hypothetical protein
MRPLICINAVIKDTTMKKIAFFVLTALFSSALWAQHVPNFGVKAGINISDWNVENVNNDVFENRLGLHLGLLSHIHLSKSIAFQPEVQFSTQGVEVAATNDKYKMSYINVPLMLQYMFDNGFRIEAGPYVGFLVDAEDEGENGTTIDRRDDYKTIDAGLGFGLNYLTYSGFGVGGRYNLGLANISEREAAIKNRVFQISLFYMFDNAHKAKSR